MNKQQDENLAAERLAIETLYRAFSDKNPDLVDLPSCYTRWRKNHDYMVYGRLV